MDEPRKPESPTSIRLPKEMRATLELIAAGERKTVSEVIILAIEQYLNPTHGKEHA